jgi:hypothetical protein
MGTALTWLKRQTADWTVLPVDHYTALDINQHASEAEIRVAYEAMQARVTASVWASVMGFVCGRSPTRLRQARDELCDPLQRKGYDEYLDGLRAMYRYPPQG